MNKLDSSYLADYIRPVLDKKYRTRSDAADYLGIDQAVLSRICSGKWHGISEHLVENICMRIGLDPAEGLLRLIICKNPKIKKYFLELTKNTSIEIIPPNKYKPSLDSKNYSLDSLLSVPFVTKDFLISGSRNSKDGKNNYIIIPIEWLPKHGNFIAFTIKDDFMNPTLPEKSIVVADLNNSKATHNKIYLYKLKNEVRVGRAFIHDKFLEFSPDNPKRKKSCNYIFDKKKIKSEKVNPILGKIVLSLKKF